MDSLEETYRHKIKRINTRIEAILREYVMIEDKKDIITDDVIKKIMDPKLTNAPPFYLAFVHSSVSNTINYEKLEFYGDGVLASSMKRYIFLGAQDKPHSQYTNYFNNYISNTGNAEYSKYLKLDDLVIHNQEITIGWQVFSDVFEAFLGALELRAARVLRGDGHFVCNRLIEVMMDRRGGIEGKMGESDAITFVEQVLRTPESITKISKETDDEYVMTISLAPAGINIISIYGTKESAKLIKNMKVNNAKTHATNSVIAVGKGETKKDAKVNAHLIAKELLESYGITEKWSERLKYKKLENMMTKNRDYRTLLSQAKENGYKYLFITNPNKWEGDGRVGYSIIGVLENKDGSFTEQDLFMTSITPTPRSKIDSNYAKVFAKYINYLRE